PTFLCTGVRMPDLRMPGQPRAQLTMGDGPEVELRRERGRRTEARPDGAGCEGRAQKKRRPTPEHAPCAISRRAPEWRSATRGNVEVQLPPAAGWVGSNQVMSRDRYRAGLVPDPIRRTARACG